MKTITELLREQQAQMATPMSPQEISGFLLGAVATVQTINQAPSPQEKFTFMCQALRLHCEECMPAPLPSLPLTDSPAHSLTA